MEPLSNAMHAATADLPPTSIDLDRIIAGDRRRHHLRLQVGTVAGAAVLGVTVMAVPAVLAGGHGGRTGVAGPHGTCPVMVVPSGAVPVSSGPGYDPSGDPTAPALSAPARSPGGTTMSPPASMEPFVDTSPTDVPQPTEDCARAAARLTADLKRMLHRDLPGLPIGIQGGSFVRFPAGGGYDGTATIGSGPTVWQLSVMVTADLPGSTTCPDRLGTCTTDPDGTEIVTEGSASVTQAIEAFAWVQHPDGTRVTLHLSPSRMLHPSAAPASGPDLPLTLDQLTDIGRGLTLFP